MRTIEEVIAELRNDIHSDVYLGNKTINTYLDEILEIHKAERPQDWIPVSERLPERHKAVIVTDIETSDTYQSRYIGNGYWECDNGTFKNRIIAWQPLPEPYKEGK